MTYTASTRDITSRFIHTLQKTEETGDIESLVALFSSNAELMNLATLEPLKGKEGAYRFWQKYLFVFNHIHSEFTNIVESENTSVLEWVSKGTLSTSEEITYRGISVLEFDGENVKRFRTYYDSAAFLPQGAKHG
ncbi:MULTISPECIES: nuclear transport factor 2 family protein [unclassified Leptolyngbya]|uniref:nuclear transport factor 2 family protein n=1 Tax=unclassified Leptolyngbya TaxID=2650499 RepID=UPI00168569E7|nr:MULTISPECIES: nuclear transport factor 2 family protein [unclassified Leptolyngbya]MBD1909120.1 nuclear transport factor 2 family protein [Leptolyngbya sp. FACHB-8]MBD2157493.1 nuclear transport factor 2 family protein [Leptolyngbya sp. FACHB-16]